MEWPLPSKEIDEPAIIPHIVEASARKYPYEVLFRSLQKLLMDTAGSEYLFCDDFFGEEAIFSEIFAGSSAVIDEHFNSILPTSFDAIGLMLMICIIHQHQVVELKLAKFVEDIIIPPRMIDMIIDGEVNDEYMRAFEILSKKLKFIEVDLMVKTSKALKDVQPQLERLRLKAVSKEHGKDVYMEVRAAYVDTMNRYPLYKHICTLQTWIVFNGDSKSAFFFK